MIPVADQSSFVFDVPVLNQEFGRSLSFGWRNWLTALEAGTGFALIMATIWTGKTLQRRLFLACAVWFSCWAMAAVWRNGLRGLKLPSPRVATFMILTAVLVAGGLIALGGALGTLHGLFGNRAPLLHGGSYLVWAVIQQWIQQKFFFARFEEITQRGLLASFITAFLFAVAHIPNPVLAPVTFLGGWIASELYRRYRSVLPLGIGHGLVGIALAVSVPDHLQHHMRVGLSYLQYMR